MFKNSGNAILFCLTIYLLLNLIVAIIMVGHVGLLQDANKVSNNVTILSWIALLWLISSIVILLKAVFNREKFDKKLKLGAILIGAVLVLSVILSSL